MLARLPGRSELLPPALRFTILFYLAHLLCSGWIASSQIFLGFALIAAAMALLRGELSIGGHSLYVPLALYCAASTISTFLRPSMQSPFPEIGEWFTFMAFPLALALYRSVPGMLALGRRTLAAVAVFLSTYGLLQFVLFGGASSGLEKRIRGTLSHVMTFSGIMLTLSLLFIGWIVRYLRDREELSDRESIRLAIPAAAAATLAVILTFTRGAWLGWTAGVAVAVLRTRPRWALVLLVLVMIALIGSPLPIFARVVSIFDTNQPSNLDRIRMVQGGVEMIRDFPFFGVGVANVKEVYPLYRLPDAPRFRIPHLHNNAVQIWAERGMFALMGYVWLIGGFAWMCFRVPSDEPLRRLYADAGLAVIAGLTVAGLFEYNFGDSEVVQVTLALMALVAGGLESSLEARFPSDEVSDSSPPPLSVDPSAADAT